MLKARNKLQRPYLDVKKQEDNHEQQLFSLKCNHQCTHDIFRDGNNSSKLWLIQLKFSSTEKGTVCFPGSKPKGKDTTDVFRG